MLDAAEAPEDISSLLDAVITKDAVPVRNWLRERSIQAGNGKSVFQAIADHFRAARIQKAIKRTALEVEGAARIMDHHRFAEYLEEKASELRTLTEKTQQAQGNQQS